MNNEQIMEQLKKEGGSKRYKGEYLELIQSIRREGYYLGCHSAIGLIHFLQVLVSRPLSNLGLCIFS